MVEVQLNLPIKENLNEGHLSNEDTACSPNHIELCTNLPLNLGHLPIQGSQLGSQQCPLYRCSTVVNCQTCSCYVYNVAIVECIP